jgi:hypothetical protein
MSSLYYDLTHHIILVSRDGEVYYQSGFMLSWKADASYLSSKMGVLAFNKEGCSTFAN